MRFDPKYRPEKAVSNDMTRPCLTEVYLDVEKQVMVSTNGSMLAIVPCQVEPGDRSGHIPTAALVEARRMRTVDGARVKARKSLADSGLALHRRTTRTFVPWEKAIEGMPKRGDKDTVTFGINPKLLLALAEAIGAYSGRLGRTPHLAITVSTRSDLAGIRVSDGNSTDAMGIIMPVRL